MPFADVNDDRLYYEITGPEGKPMILQFGGSLFGRANFDTVNDGFRENFRLLSYDASGYGRSTRPIIEHTIERWAHEAAGLLDALGIEKVFVHGTSMGGMIAIAFTALYPEKVIAGCADCSFLRGDVHRRTLTKNWRNMAASMPSDEMADLVTIQAVSADFLEEHPEIFGFVRQMISQNDPYTVQQCTLATERMDLEPLVPSLSRPLLLTNGTRDIMTPPDLAPSGYSARDLAKARPDIVTLYEFPTIGHADLLEAPEEAVQVVTEFFHKALK